MITQQQAVVVSSATEGIGRDTAKLLARAGFKVYAGVLTREALANWDAADISAGTIVPLLLDITKSEDIAALDPSDREHSRCVQTLTSQAARQRRRNPSARFRGRPTRSRPSLHR